MKFAPIASTLVASNGTSTMQTMTSRVNAEGARRLQEIVVNLYSDPKLAAVREAVANACDSTRRAGSNIPVDVIAPTPLEPNLVITDRGTGMSMLEVEDHFLAFAASSKRDTNDEIGGLGVGAKSPWAISESFLIDTVKDGRRTLVRAARDLTHQVLVAGEPTDLPTGTTVSIPVDLRGDTAEWARLVLEVATAHDPGAVTVNGKPVVSIAGSEQRIGPVLCKRVRQGYGRAVMIRSGGTLFESVYSLDNRMSQKIKLKAFVIELPIGSFDHTPSRETVIDTERTRAAIDAAVAEYQAAYEVLEQKISKLAEADVTAAVTLRKKIVGEAGDYTVLPINVFLEVPGGSGAWVSGGRWQRVEPPQTKDTFSATSWDTEVDRTLLVTGVPAGRALRTFATWLKNSRHRSVRRVIPIPEGQTGIDLVVTDKNGPNGQTFRLEPSMLPADNTYTWEEWSKNVASVRSSTPGGSRGPAAGYTCLVVAQDGSYKQQELDSAQIKALNLPVWYAEADDYSGERPQIVPAASVGILLGRRKTAPMLRAIPAAMTIRAWHKQCYDAQIGQWSHETKLALAAKRGHDLTLFRVALEAEARLSGDGGRSYILLDQAAAIAAAAERLTPAEVSAWDTFARGQHRDEIWRYRVPVESLRKALIQAWPLLDEVLSHYSEEKIQAFADYVAAVEPKRQAGVSLAIAAAV